MQAIYLNPLTDFGFKKLFGEEPNKDLLISFLNTLLPAHHQVSELTYTKNEYQGISAADRKVIFDLNCLSPSGERFIVELQRVKQIYFKDRSLFYSTFAIQEQAKRGDWNYKLAAVYTIGILDFLMDDHEQDVLYHAQLKDQHNRLFYDKLNFIYLVLPRFNLQQHELVSLQDKWLFAFKHLHELDHIPTELHERIFQRLFNLAKIAQLPAEERQVYESSLKDYRDFMSAQDTAHLEGYQEGIEEGKQMGLEEGLEKGRQEGLEEGKRETARRLLAKGMSVELVAELVGLSLEAVQALV
ncbi:MAG: Rpn family recombination-promoting nuclease/putative transposase [Thiolinea sp.]